MEKSNSVHEGLNVVPRLPSNVMDLRTKTQIKLKIEESCVMEEYHTFFIAKVHTASFIS